eukprot:comp20630_c0_seq1/m.26688 comp20630_c0_seq1/g.26688  ORF comp20630_c0_seq1/g.26688 comp20630_c0_seq1/m.26688 type:complete len:334 (-) comp20630_c0_seq1:1615-2616(-)
MRNTRSWGVWMRRERKEGGRREGRRERMEKQRGKTEKRKREKTSAEREGKWTRRQLAPPHAPTKRGRWPTRAHTKGAHVRFLSVSTCLATQTHTRSRNHPHHLPALQHPQHPTQHPLHSHQHKTKTQIRAASLRLLLPCPRPCPCPHHHHEQAVESKTKATCTCVHTRIVGYRLTGAHACNNTSYTRTNPPPPSLPNVNPSPHPHYYPAPQHHPLPQHQPMFHPFPQHRHPPPLQVGFCVLTMDVFEVFLRRKLSLDIWVCTPRAPFVCGNVPFLDATRLSRDEMSFGSTRKHTQPPPTPMTPTRRTSNPPFQPMRLRVKNPPLRKFPHGRGV